MFSGLPSCRHLLLRDPPLPREQRRRGYPPRSPRSDRRRRCACASSRAQRGHGLAAQALQLDQHADSDRCGAGSGRPCRRCCWKCATRLSAIASPVLPEICLDRLARRCLPRNGWASIALPGCTPSGRVRRGHAWPSPREGDEVLGSGHEVGLAVELDHGRVLPARARTRSRPGPARRCGRRASRPWRCPSCGGSRRPCPCRRWPPRGPSCNPSSPRRSGPGARRPSFAEIGSLIGRPFHVSGDPMGRPVSL